MRKPDRLAGGIVALVVGLLAFGSLHGWAEDNPPYPVERKPDPVTKNDKIDKNDEEIVAPEHLVIAGGNITITSRTFEPPEKEKGWKFKSFGTTHVDIHEDDPPDGLSRYVVPPTATNDTSTRIKVEAAGLVSDAGEWPLRCEGNLQPPPGPPRPPVTIPHWSAKMVKAGKIGIADVVRDGNSSLPYSVSPTKPKELAVTFALDMVGKTVTFTIEGVNADNGTASLQGTAPITLTQSGTITVQGGTGEQQTKSGNDKQLYVKATCDGKEVGRNTGFSVCAHPVSTRKGPGYDMVNDGTWAGMRISLAFDPDSGTAEHLDEVRVSEQIDPTHYEVFGSFRGIPFAPRTSSFKTVADSNADELFAQPSQIINICTTHGGSGGYTNHQNFIFYCRRCGMTADKAVVIPNSGYKNAFEIQKGAGTRIDFKVTSRPAAVTVNDYSAQAGPSEGKADAVRIRD